MTAQNVTYQYDAAGNRKARIIELQKSPASRSAEAETPEPVVDVIAKQEIKIYPNPTKGLLKVEIGNFSDDLTGNIAIFDSSGKTVVQVGSLSAENSLDISRQADGIYFLKIKVGDEVSTWKIIKK
jgi:hypothetical protein